jgi:hypothetical protein
MALLIVSRCKDAGIVEWLVLGPSRLSFVQSAGRRQPRMQWDTLERATQPTRGIAVATVG